MHTWGDDWPHWADMDELVSFCYRRGEELGLTVISAKEKYGSLRLWAAGYSDEQYRQLYVEAVERWPHLKAEILNDSDNPQLLVGIVPESECDHAHYWVRADGCVCGVCMKELGDVGG